MNDESLELLASVISDPDIAREIPDTIWPSIIDHALTNGLGPMLLWCLKSGNGSVPARLDLTPLINSARQAAVRSVLLEQSHQEVNSALRDAMIPALWLKGAALARTIYPQSTLRPMVDLDVLVPYEQREEALAVVQRIGYNFHTLNSLRPRSTGDELTLKLSHHYHLKGGIANNIALELHFRLLGHNDELLSLEQLQWFWTQKQTINLDDGAEFDTLTPEAHLLYLCAHAMLQHGEASLDLLRLLDFHQIITQNELKWDVIIDQAVLLGWTFAVERALSLSMIFFATPVPETVLHALRSRRPAYEDVSRVARLTGVGNRWERVRQKLKGLSLRDTWAYVVLIAIPARSYVRHRYNLRPGQPTWPYYFYRWFDQARDMFWSTWKRLTGQYR